MKRRSRTTTIKNISNMATKELVYVLRGFEKKIKDLEKRLEKLEKRGQKKRGRPKKSESKRRPGRSKSKRGPGRPKKSEVEQGVKDEGIIKIPPEPTPEQVPESEEKAIALVR